MVTLLVAMGVMAVMLSVALPMWETANRREREAELVFRGEQYIQAIRLFQRRYAGTFPPSLDVLLEQRFLRRRYKDPVTHRDFRVLHAGIEATPMGARSGEPRRTGPEQVTTPLGPEASGPAVLGRGGIIGVVSTSTRTSLRRYNGRGRYDEWTFVATDATTQATATGVTLTTPTLGRGSRQDAGLPVDDSVASPGGTRLMPLPPLRGRGIRQ
jgi:type II secretory pathway pseudopilin PulG